MSYWDWFIYLKDQCPSHYDMAQWEQFMMREANALFRDNKITADDLGRIINQVCDW